MNYNDDLNYMIAELEKQHLCLYFSHTKEEIEEFKENLIHQYPLDNEYNFNYVSKCLLAKISDNNDQHTIITQPLKLLPIKLKYINNKLYISCDSKVDNYKNVVKINNIRIKKLISEFEKTIPTFTEERLKMHLERKDLGFSNMFVIKSMPSIPNNTTNFIFELNDGTILNYDYNTSYEYPIPQKNIYELIIRDNIPIIHYRKCMDLNGSMNKLLSQLKETNSKKFVVDLRGNYGGNSSVIKPLCKFLKNKNVCVLINHHVFSSGVMAIMDLKNIGATTIGTKVGMPLNGFGNTSKPIELPYSKLKVYYSVKYFEVSIKRGKYKLSTILSLSKLNKKYNKNKETFNVKYFEPDVFIEPTINDYKKGIDPMLNKAIELLNK